jgi:hypothetical protein
MARAPRRSKKKQVKAEEKLCDCLGCRLHIGVLEIAAIKSDETGIEVNAPDTLDGLIPVVGILLAGVHMDDLEPYWRRLLESRCRALDKDTSVHLGLAGRA